MRNVILLAMLLLACCQQQAKGTPESWKRHCAATAQIRADRFMNNAYRQGGSAYDAEAMKRKFEVDCLERLQREQTLPPHQSRF